MAIEKGLYAAPLGLTAGDSDFDTMEESEMSDAALEIEILDPEAVTLSDGSMEITLIPGDDDDFTEFGMNLAEVLDESHLNELSDELVGQIQTDIEGRRDWADTFVKGWRCWASSTRSARAVGGRVWCVLHRAG
jgi:hypothetical protein